MTRWFIIGFFASLRMTQLLGIRNEENEISDQNRGTCLNFNPFRAVPGVFTKHNNDGKQILKQALRCAFGENTKRGRLSTSELCSEDFLGNKMTFISPLIPPEQSSGVHFQISLTDLVKTPSVAMEAPWNNTNIKQLCHSERSEESEKA